MATASTPAAPAASNVFVTDVGLVFDAIANSTTEIKAAIAAGGTNIGADATAAEKVAGGIFTGLSNAGNQIFTDIAQVWPFAVGIIDSFTHAQAGTTPVSAPSSLKS